MNGLDWINKKSWSGAVSKSTSYRGVARTLGINYRSDISSIIEELGINTDHFTHGKTNTNIIGRKFGKLTIQTAPLPVKRGLSKEHYYVDCLCDCGNMCCKRIDSVKSGRIISCGCAIVEKGRFMIGSNNQSFKGCGELGAIRFSDIKRNAARREIKFDITIEYVWDLFEKQQRKCALSGVDLWFGRATIPLSSNASLDRIDSKYSYIPGNVQWVHKDINLMKRSFTTEYFAELCKLVANHANKE